MLKNESRSVAHALFLPMLALVGVMLAGCGKDEAPATQQGTASSQGAASHTVTTAEHEAFEKKYTEMCIKSQQSNASTQLSNDQQLGKVCQCMANDVSKRLSKAEVVHFLDKKEFPMELVMMTDAAANHCLSAQ